MFPLNRHINDRIATDPCRLIVHRRIFFYKDPRLLGPLKILRAYHLFGYHIHKLDPDIVRIGIVPVNVGKLTVISSPAGHHRKPVLCTIALIPVLMSIFSL